MEQVRQQYPAWQFSSSNDSYANPIKGPISRNTVRAQKGPIEIVVERQSNFGGSGLGLEFEADEVRVLELPAGNRLYEFTGLHMTGNAQKRYNISIISHEGVAENNPLKIADHYFQYSTNRGKIEVGDSTTSVEEVKKIRSTDDYQAAINILQALYAENSSSE